MLSYFTRSFEYMLLNIDRSVYSIFGGIVDSTFYSIFWVVFTRLFCCVPASDLKDAIVKKKVDKFYAMKQWNILKPNDRNYCF